MFSKQVKGVRNGENMNKKNAKAEEGRTLTEKNGVFNMSEGRSSEVTVRPQMQVRVFDNVDQNAT